MSLYQKPGGQSTEFKLALGALLSPIVAFPIGAYVLHKVNFWAGLGVMGGVTLIATGVAVSYVLGRSKVKVAAEQSKPPPRRVV
jgi:hypothetical protein